MRTHSVLFTELRQNKALSLTLLTIAIFLGVAAHLMQEADTAIRNLVRTEYWSADMAILPKGVTLPMLANELRTDDIKDFLPEALFHTTVDMTAGQLRMAAVLPVMSQQKAVVRRQGDPSVSFSGWNIPVEDWQEQTEHLTNEWGYKVIAAAFASGPTPELEKLKAVIDRKTVAQAVWIDEAQKAARDLQARLSTLSLAIEVLLLTALVLALALAGSLFYQRHSETQQCLIDLGWAPSRRKLLQVGLAVILLLLPLAVGYAMVPPETIANAVSAKL